MLTCLYWVIANTPSEIPFHTDLPSYSDNEHVKENFSCLVITFNQNCSKWFLPHDVYAYFLCRLMCTWIHESDAELINFIWVFFFFLRCFNILHYASGFYMLLFFRQMFLTCLCVCVCVCVCVLFTGIVQHNWACLTWKSAIEIKSLLLLTYQGKSLFMLTNCCWVTMNISKEILHTDPLLLKIKDNLSSWVIRTYQGKSLLMLTNPC